MTEILVVKETREGRAMTVKRESLETRGRRVDPEHRLAI